MGWGKNRFLIILLVILLLVALAQGIFLIIKPQPSSQSLTKKVFVAFTGEKVPLGISSPVYFQGYTSIMVTGVLRKVYKQGLNNLVEVELPINDRPTMFTVDFGNDSQPIRISTIEETKIETSNTQPATESAAKTSELKRVNYVAPNKEILSKVDDYINQVIQIEIPIEINIPSNRECKGTCQLMLAAFNRYKNNNKILLSPNNKDTYPTLGGPISIQFSR